MKDEVIKDILLQTEIIPEKHMVCSKFISIYNLSPEPSIDWLIKMIKIRMTFEILNFEESQVKRKSLRSKSYSPTRLHKLQTEGKSEPG